jgi:hypothetical protein
MKRPDADNLTVLNLYLNGITVGGDRTKPQSFDDGFAVVLFLPHFFCQY